jgi:hypothetical protein
MVTWVSVGVTLWAGVNAIVVGYIIGLTKNARFEVLADGLVSAAEEAFKATAEKQRCFGECQYAKHPRASPNCLPLRQHKHVRE